MYVCGLTVVKLRSDVRMCRQVPGAQRVVGGGRGATSLVEDLPLLRLRPRNTKEAFRRLSENPERP